MLIKLRNLVSSIFGGTENPNRAATVAQLNDLIEIFNKSEIFASQKFKFLATYDSIKGLTMYSVVKSCAAGGSGCWSCLNSCAYQNANAVASFARSSAGVYVLTIKDTDFSPYQAVSVTVGNLETSGTGASVIQTTPGVWTITTFDTTSGAAGDHLNNTLISVEFFASKTQL